MHFWVFDFMSELPVPRMSVHDGMDALAHVLRGREVELVGILNQAGLLQPIGERQLDICHKLLVRPRV